jgi:hypothetical protein
MIILPGGSTKMKKVLIAFLIGIVIGVILMVFLQPTSSNVSKQIVSREKNSFYPVTARLNPGGGLYLYLGTEQLIKSVRQRIDKLKNIILGDGSLAESRSQEIEELFRLLNRFIHRSGIDEISGIGSSMIELENDLHHSKLIFHHYKGDNNGLLWNLFASKAKFLESLNMLPKDTVLATFNDFRPTYIWKWLKQQVGESDILALQKITVIWDAALKMQGISLDDLLPSLHGQIGFILTLDKETLIKFPVGSITIEIPEPRAALLIPVKDESLLNLLKMMYPGTHALNGVPHGFRFPASSLPFPFEPVVVQRDGFLVLASSPKIIHAIWQAKKNRNGLKATETFIKISADMPMTGNGFRFVGPRFLPFLKKIHKARTENTLDEQNGYKALMELLNPLPQNFMLYSVVKKTNDGLMITANHNIDLEGVLMLPAVTTIGIGASFFRSGYSQKKAIQ